MQQILVTNSDLVINDASDCGLEEVIKGKLLKNKEAKQHSGTVQQSKSDESKKETNPSGRKKRKRFRKRPYSVRNFLGRPKINAPANTTQFLCADKEYYDNNSASNLKTFDMSTSNSEGETSINTSSSTQMGLQVRNNQSDDASYESNFVDDDTFFTEEFDQMYDSIRTELLRNESVEELTSRCMELESAVHNLRYLLQKETSKRQKIEELSNLLLINKELLQKNNVLQQAKLSKNPTETHCSISMPEIVSKPSNSLET